MSIVSIGFVTMLLDLSKKYAKGVWCLEGPDNTILLIATKNLVKYLVNLLYAIDVGDRNVDPQLVKDFRTGKVTLRLIEDCGFEDSMSLNMRLGVIQRNLIGQKYYSNQKLGTKWSVVVKPIRIGYRPLVGVFLKPSNSASIGKLTVLGLFNTKVEAFEWKELYYTRPFVDRVVFAFNKATSGYYNQ